MGKERLLWVRFFIVKIRVFLVKTISVEIKRVRSVHLWNVNRHSRSERVKEFREKLDAAINKNAPRFSFPINGTHDAAIEAKVRKQMQAKGATVICTAMDRNSWQIVKNNIGIPLRRNKTGWVLYKLPGEKWARLSTFFYNESYAGGGRYSSSAGASHFLTFRWQKGS